MNLRRPQGAHIFLVTVHALTFVPDSSAAKERNMSRYDELTKLFDPWRKNWVEQYREHQLLPPRIAKSFQEFLGCPDAFQDTSGAQVKYVSPARAKWDDRTDDFMLHVYESFIEDVEFRNDGYFYFGLRVLLEHGPRTFPKQSFWFLLRGKQLGRTFTVWVQRSGRDFILDSEANNRALCEHFLELLKEDLSVSPISRTGKGRNRIGFVPSES